MTARLLVVEDDGELRQALADTLELAGYAVLTAEDGSAALQLLEREPVDLVVSDVNMPGLDGIDLLRAVQRQLPQLPVLLMTAYASISKSVEAMRCGAVDYLVKPFRPQQLVDCIARYTGAAHQDGAEPVAEAAASRRLFALARRVAATDSTVLIMGESGTGKEVLARHVHQHSPRAKGPFVAINCAAIPDTMLEAILFGHERGAFTGAHSSRPGKFEQANGGTLLLDEVSEMPVELQAKLLRVIQEREVERLGGRGPVALDVRLIATTNRQLQREVEEGRFREDLFYRLSVFPLQWPALRQRPEDILPLAQRLLADHASRMGRVPATLEPAARERLLAHHWPGNVRELDNVIQRALVLQPGPTIGDDDLLLDPWQGLGEIEETGAEADQRADLHTDLQQREFDLILDTLRACGGHRQQTAEQLGISPRTLRYKLARMREEGIDVEGILANR